ncbi:extra-large guanine nucleotide-binding protein 1 [Forsythia ovata]|uniref:Extra-large guanine nucleotide-binding protein 1 n=1 Tax=Forsythia ovata TaxID=205694 RepID=A0ABD1WZE6_9LAMI
MTSVMRSIFPASSSTSMEYSGPPIKYDIIQGFRLMFDVRCIPTVAVAAKVLSNLSLPIIQPIVKSKHSEKKLSNGQYFSSPKNEDQDEFVETQYYKELESIECQMCYMGINLNQTSIKRSSLINRNIQSGTGDFAFARNRQSPISISPNSD